MCLKPLVPPPPLQLPVAVQVEVPPAAAEEVKRDDDDARDLRERREHVKRPPTVR